MVCTLIILALKTWGQEDQGFKVDRSYVVSSRTAMVPEDLVLKNLYYTCTEFFLVIIPT